MIGHADGHPTRYEDPGCALAAGRKSSARFHAPASPLPPSPAAPHEPCRTSSARLMQDPRRSRALDAPQAAGSPRQVGAPRCRASRDFFDLRAGSPQALSSSSIRPRRRLVGSCGRRPRAVEPLERVASRGHSDAADSAAPASSHARKREREAVSVLTHGPSSDLQPTHRPSDPGTIPSVLSSRAKRGQKTNSASCPREAARCRHVAHAARIAMPSALQAGRPVRRVGMSPLFRPTTPPATLDRTPTAFQPACRFAESQFRGGPRRSAEMPPLLRSGNPLRWIPGPSQQSTLRRRDPNPPPPSPQRTAAAIPTTGSVGRRPPCQMKSSPVPLPTRNPVTECSRICPQAFQMQRCRLRRSAALERLPDHDPRQQRGEGHSRSYSKTSITASQANRMLLHIVPGQPVCLDSPSPHKLPPRRHPGLSAPERNARSQRPAASSQAPGHPAYRCRASRLAAACRLRRSCRRDRGPVALPRSGCPVRRSRHPAALSKPARAPPPAAPRGILRSRSAAPPQIHARKTPCHIHTTIRP